MKTQKLGSALFLVLISSTSSFAAATAEEAQRIQGVFQTYIGAEPGVLTVAPAGDAYDIIIDISPYLKKITLPGFTSKVDAIKIQATPNGDGTWAYTPDANFNGQDSFRYRVSTPLFI